MNQSLKYNELQRRLPLWVYVILSGLNISYIYSFVYMPEQWFVDGVIKTDLIISLALMFLVNVLAFVVRLEIMVSNDDIRYRFWPFHLAYRIISKNDIKKCYVRRYNPVFEFGGWGIRGWKNNRAYSLSGRFGLQLELNTGRKILLGTRNPEALRSFLKTVGFYYE